MKIYISSDHAGFELKHALIERLKKSEYGEIIIDKGPAEYNKDDDYPDFISLTAKEVSKDPTGSKGIVIGFSGQGEGIVANRFSHVRAAVYYGGPLEILILSREHNNSNILSLGSKFLSSDEAWVAGSLWLATPFSELERHERR